MKRLLCILLVTMIVILQAPVIAFAEDNSQCYKYELTIDGKEEKKVETGDIITVVLTLYRTDEDEPYTMHAMQDEIRYDSEFFELVADSELLASEVQFTDIAMRDRHREFYMNYLSFGNGQQWDAKTLVGSFQLKVIADTGVAKITNEDHLVSLQDGSDSYFSEANELTVFLSDDCLIKFETNGGSKIGNVIAAYGKKLKAPKSPTKDGMYFAGWYKDIDLLIPWNFDEDIVDRNMTLYAMWSTSPVEGQPEGGLSWLWFLIIIALMILLILFKRKKDEKSNDAPSES